MAAVRSAIHLSPLSRFPEPALTLVSTSLPLAAMAVTSAVFSLLMMHAYIPLLSIYAALGLTLFVVFRMALYPFVQRKTRESLQLSSQAQSILLETIRAISTVKLLGYERDRSELWLSRQASATYASQSVSLLSVFGSGTARIIIGALQVGTWWFGGSMVIHHQLSLGRLVAFNIYSLQLANAVSSLAAQIMQYRTMSIHRERLADIVATDAEPYVETSPHRRLQRSMPPLLDVKNVSFRYGDFEPWILKDLDLSIEPGEFIAITGPSGGGKTTFLKVIFGLYTPQAGWIEVDGCKVLSSEIIKWRSRVGAVMQDDRLMSG